MNTDRFHALAAAPGPFVSLFIEGTAGSSRRSVPS